MAFKLAVFSCLLAAAYGSVAPAAVAYSAPVVAAAPVAARLEEFDAYPQYRFGYDVADSLTGDYKSQTEQRDGDVVQGQYSLVEADGTRRIVDYAADPVNGFNAVVRNEPLVAAAPAVVAEPAVVSARFAAAPIAQPVVAARYAVAAPARVVAAAPAPARYVAAAPAPARYVAAAPAPAVAEPVFARYAAAPFANYPAAARFSAPVAYRSPVAYSAAYTGPVAAAYSAPVAAAYSAPVAAAYSAQVAQYSGPVSYAPYAPGYAVAQPARLVAPAAVRAAPAKIVEPIAAAGYRYP